MRVLSKFEQISASGGDSWGGTPEGQSTANGGTPTQDPSKPTIFGHCTVLPLGKDYDSGGELQLCYVIRVR